jgi:hypothetical protein
MQELEPIRHAGRLFATLGLLALLFSSCAWTTNSNAFSPLIGKEGVFTLVNLHPDEQRSRLYAVNYQQAGLIPLCSKVELLDLGSKRMKFRVEKTGKVYEYIYHGAAAEPFPTHLGRYFGRECNRSKVEALSQIDRTGIRRGKALVGMSRQGVTYAIGFPPRHVNPDLDAAEWTYWKSRFNRFVVEFDEGRVANVRD